MKPASLTSTLGIIIQNRKAFKKIIDGMSASQLNTIPTGFNNNIYWNVAHVIAVQQRLIYGLAGIQFTVPQDFVKEFAPGTKPEREYTAPDITYLLELLLTSSSALVSDLEEGKFTAIQPFTTALNFKIKSIEDAVSFNLFHEALHMGHILNLRKFI